MPDRLEYLRYWWVDVAGLPEDVFYELLASYGQAHRGYHGTSHLEDMLSKLEAWNTRNSLAFEEGLIRRVVIDIFSHDVIYAVGPDAIYNEMHSAAQAYRFCCERLKDRGLARNVRADILRTENHFDHLPGEDFALQVLLDLDLSGLGSDPNQYDKNTAGIRKEVGRAHTEDQWRLGRQTFLKMALATPKLFRTAYAISKWEAQARVNMDRELQELLA